LLIEVKNLHAGYGFLQILWDVSLNIDTGEYVCIVGPNGAGKSTTLKSIAGIVKPAKGDVCFNGQSIKDLSIDKICKLGISYISEELNLFTQMTVRENLYMGAYTISEKKEKLKNLDYVYELFPRLKERKDQLAGTMSGGERKMLAIGRGIMSSPSVLLVDEPSLGLDPKMTASVFKALDVLKENKITILLVEQNVTKTLQATDRGYVIEKGKIILEGESSALSENEHVRKAFLGV